MILLKMGGRLTLEFCTPDCCTPLRLCERFRGRVNQLLILMLLQNPRIFSIPKLNVIKLYFILLLVRHLFLRLNVHHDTNMHAKLGLSWFFKFKPACLMQYKNFLLTSVCGEISDLGHFVQTSPYELGLYRKDFGPKFETSRSVN